MSEAFRSVDEFSAEEVTQMVRVYCRTLDELGYTPTPFADVDAKVGGSIYSAGKFEVLNHAMWMCGEIEAFVRQNRMAKAYRWIGMVQGLLFMGGVYSIAELKEHNVGS